MSLGKDIYFEVRKHKESSDKYKSEDASVLEAIEETIRTSKGDQTALPSPVEYFSCFMSSLSCSNDHYRSLLFLLHLILPSISDNVLRLKCNDCLDILLNVYKTYENVMEPSSIRSLVSCICLILCKQELVNDIWESSLVKKSFNLVLSFSMHDSGKVRRYVQDSIQPLLEYHAKNGFVFSSKQIVRQLDVLCKTFNEEDYHETIHYLVFVARICSLIHSSFYPLFFTTLLKIRQHQCPMLDYRCLRPIEILIDSNEYIEMSWIESIYTQLMNTPCLNSNTAKDLCEYACVLCLCCRIFMKHQHEDCYSSFLTLMKAIFSYFETANGELHKELSLFLISYFTSMKDIMIPEEIATQFMQLINSTLQFRYQHAWIYLFPIISGVAKFIGTQYPILLSPTIQQLVAIYDSSVRGDASFQLLLTKTLGYCVEAIGVANFFQYTTVLDASGLPDENHYYLFEIVNDHSKHTHSSLCYFFSHIVPIAKSCHIAANQSSNPILKRRYQTYVTDLWSMFTSFCVCADDAADALQQYGNSILGAMTDCNYKELSVIICKGLTLLIRSNQLSLQNQSTPSLDENEEDDSVSDDSLSQMSEEGSKDIHDDTSEEILPFLDILKTTRAPRIDPMVAKHTIEIIQPQCENLLLTLLSLYEQWHGDYSEEIPRYSGIGKGGDNLTVQVIRCTIETILSISPSDLVSKLLNQILSKLLVAFTNEDPNQQKYCIGQSIILTGLLSTVIQFIQDSEITIILRCIKPHLSNDEIPILQKRVYFCLLCLCRYHSYYLLQSLLTDLQTILTDSILTMNVISKKYRLRCYDYLSMALDPSNSLHLSFLIQSLPEVILCSKDPSRKVRAVCSHVLIQYAEIMKASSTSYTLPDGSQAVASLSQFIEILTGIIAAQNPHMQAAALVSLAVIFSHFKTEDLRLIELNILHIAYSLIHEDNREIATACLKYIRICCRLLNDEDLSTELPSIIQAVLVDIQSNKNRCRAKIHVIMEILVKRVDEEELKQLIPPDDEPLIASILRSERRRMNAKLKNEEESSKQQMTRTRWIKEGEDPMDLLNVEDITRGITSRKDDDDDDNDNEIEMDEQGRFIVHDDEEEIKKNQKQSRDDDDEEEEKIPVKGIRRESKLHQKRKDKKISKVEQDGSRFRSTRARGDMKKGNMQPYAYIQLDSRMLSKKKQNQSLGKFNNLIGAAKRGAKEGASHRKKH